MHLDPVLTMALQLLCLFLQLNPFKKSTMLFSTATIATMAAFYAQSAAADRVGKRCTGSISSLSDVSAAVACTTININSFTVDAGKTFELDCASGTTVNVLGDVTFGVSNWAGPLFQISCVWSSKFPQFRCTDPLCAIRH